MNLINTIDDAIEELKKNEYGIIVKKTKKNMIITTSIKFPKEILNKDISDMSIEFLLIIDLSKPKSTPKLYCISPYCSPHFADGRDIFKELPTSKNPKKVFIFRNILSEILEFIKANFQKGCLNFFGNYYLGSRYDLKMLQKGGNNIFYAKENITINGKFLSQNRVLIMSDVYFLLFEQEKWYKNNLTLLFWSSISNVQKIQKVKDNKGLILHWIQKEKEPYAMNLTLSQRDNFIDILLEKMKLFGMIYDIKKLDPNINGMSDNKKKKAKIFESQNEKLINNKNDELYNVEEEEKNEDKNVNNEKFEEEEEYDEEEEEEEDDVENNEEDEKEKEKNDNNIVIENSKNEENKLDDKFENEGKKGQEKNGGENVEQNIEEKNDDINKENIEKNKIDEKKDEMVKEEKIEDKEVNKDINLQPNDVIEKKEEVNGEKKEEKEEENKKEDINKEG